MQIYRSLAELPTPMPRTVAAIGNFDGVHRGHREVIARVLDRARALHSSTAPVQAIAVTFDPHPLALLHPERAPQLITPLPQRLRLLAQTGLDATLVIPFTLEFSRLSARQFAQDILCQTLHVAEVHEGDTFRFGHNAAAGIEDLRELGRACSFDVVSHGAFQIRGIPISSSEVRRRISAGQLGMARALLGRSFSILSAPVRDRGVGTKLNTPTINFAPYAELLPPNGVYVTRIRLGDEPGAPLCNAVTNIGVRPTFDAGFAIETHLLDGPPPIDLTESTPLELSFLLRLRDEQRFPNPDALKSQILKDVAHAQKYFRRASANWREPSPPAPSTLAPL